MNSDQRPSLGFVGIHAGARLTQPVSQNETISALFEQAGYRVKRTSAVKRPSLRTFHQIWSLVTWKDVDFAIVAVFSGPSFWIADFSSWLAQRIRPKKVVFFLHGGNLGVYGAAHRKRVSRVFDRADLILAPSDFLADVFRDWGYDVRVIPNVLRLDGYPYTERQAARPALLWMRTFNEAYDPELAIEVLARLSEVHPDMRLTMGGADQGGLESTKQRARDLAVTERVRFAGYLNQADKARAMVEHDIFLNTNRIDNMPVSVIEASSAGMVPVATAVGGIPALLTDGVDSCLVPVGDADAMSAAVLGLLDDPARFVTMSKAARALAERSDWTAVRKLWEIELQRLLPERDWPANRDLTAPVVIDDLTEEDLSTVADLHIRAFPDSELGRLGHEAVSRNYQWQFDGPHDLTALAARSNGHVVGFLFGGVFRGSTIGFVKRERWFLLGRVLRNPGMVLRRTSLNQLKLAGRLLARRQATPGPERPEAVPRKSFGVLSIAVDPALQRSGAGRMLMAEARRRAGEDGFSRMHLTVHPGNKTAVRFYEQGGWHRRITNDDGRWTGQMVLELEQPS